MSVNPSGLCMCGCGEATPIAKNSHARSGHVKGEPVRYIFGHQSRLSPVEYLEQDCGYETPCWVWQRALDAKGYGQMRVAGRLRRAPRVFYARVHGAIPEGRQLDHLCRNRACVNPDHLEVVTPAENSRRGAATKLTAEKVSIIKGLLRDRVLHRHIAERFGVSVYTIWDISQGNTWKDVA